MNICESSDEEKKLCEFCREQNSKYLCPKCLAPYCSLNCYKSEAHVVCSEIFYKDCVENELKSQVTDPESIKKFVDSLKKLNATDFEPDLNGQSSSEEEIDSDDDNVPDLTKRLEGVDINDSDQLWKILTPAEKQEFMQFAESDEALELVPNWKPWWNTFLNDNSDEDSKEDLIDPVPAIIEVPKLNDYSKASPLIKYNIIQIIHSYTFTILYFNGEHRSDPLGTLYTILLTNTSLRDNEIYYDCIRARMDVILCISRHEILFNNKEAYSKFDGAADFIWSNSELVSDNKYHLVLIALSDLYNIINEVKSKKLYEKQVLQQYNFLGVQHYDKLSIEKITKKNILLMLKKLEFYVSWLKHMI